MGIQEYLEKRAAQEKHLTQEIEENVIKLFNLRKGAIKEYKTILPFDDKHYIIVHMKKKKMEE